MEFAKEFFEGEEREGFYIVPMMKKAWAAQLEVLSEIDRICKKHNIQYFVDWGTLLGTIRHKGFIPWDDDMDICMKREDFNKFFQIVKDELPPYFCVLNIHTSDNYGELLGRILNGNAIRFDEEFLGHFHGCPYAVGIDIFPLDYIAPTKGEEEVQCQLINMVLTTARSIEAYAEDGDISEEMIDNLLLQIQNLCGVEFEKEKSIKNQLYKLGERLSSMYNEEEAKEVTLMPKFAVYSPHYRIPKECYAEAVEMEFEGMKVPVPIGYETILELKYGKDYMTPINRKSSHDYPFYRKQERMVYEKLGFIPE